MKIMAWNVNGIRACARRGFLAWLAEARPSILGLQEVRARPDQIPPEILEASGYRSYWSPAERPGYSGVGLLVRRRPREVREGLGEASLDGEGRIQIAVFETFVFFNVYFPNGSGRERDNSRVPFKLAFYDAVLERALEFRKGGLGVVIAGDFNTAHREIDLKNWRSNQKTSGFLPEEREAFGRFLEGGFRDVFRDRHPDEPGHYTWWSQRQGARERNVGWRIDYLLVSEDLAPHVRRAWIEPHVPGSDHCPLGIDLVLPGRKARRS